MEASVRQELLRRRDRAARVARSGSVASVVLAAAFVVDVVSMPHCGPAAVDPGWFAGGTIVLAIAATVAEGSVRSRERELGEDPSRATGLMVVGWTWILGSMIGAALVWVATGFTQAFDCTGGPTPPL